MATHRSSVLCPRGFVLAGVLFLLSTVITYSAVCGPVGGYDGPSGIQYVIVNPLALGVAYGNGCAAHVATLPIAVGVLCLGIGAYRWQTNR